MIQTFWFCQNQMLFVMHSIWFWWPVQWLVPVTLVQRLSTIFATEIQVTTVSNSSQICSGHSLNSFPFENFLGFFKVRIHSGFKPLQQFVYYANQHNSILKTKQTKGEERILPKSSFVFVSARLENKALLSQLLYSEN